MAGTRDPVYGLDNFEKTKILSESQTIVNNFLILLYGKPGFYPSVPLLGLDIQQYLYNFTDDIDTDQIKAAVAYQCPRFVKHVQDGTFDVVKTFYKDQPMLIFVLPAIVAEKEKRIIVGVSVNLKGEMIFNFNIED